MKDYFCKLIDQTPDLAKDFALKFENMKKTKRAYWKALEEFDKVHKSFFFHSDDATEDSPLFWEYPSPDAKRQRKS